MHIMFQARFKQRLNISQLHKNDSHTYISVNCQVYLSWTHPIPAIIELHFQYNLNRQLQGNTTKHEKIISEATQAFTTMYILLCIIIYPIRLNGKMKHFVLQYVLQNYLLRIIIHWWKHRQEHVMVVDSANYYWAIANVYVTKAGNRATSRIQVRISNMFSFNSMIRRQCDDQGQ